MGQNTKAPNGGGWGSRDGGYTNYTICPGLGVQVQSRRYDARIDRGLLHQYHAVKFHTTPVYKCVYLSRSVGPPGRGGDWDEPTKRWRAVPGPGSRPYARGHAPGAIDSVLKCVKRLVGQRTTNN